MTSPHLNSVNGKPINVFSRRGRFLGDFIALVEIHEHSLPEPGGQTLSLLIRITDHATYRLMLSPREAHGVLKCLDNDDAIYFWDGETREITPAAVGDFLFDARGDPNHG